MDIKDLRKKHSLSRWDLLQKLKPHLEQMNAPLINERMLATIEDGGHLKEPAREKALLESMNRAFPEVTDQISIKSKKSILQRVGKGHFSIIIFALFSILLVSLYFLTQSQEHVINVLSIISSAATILALIYAVYKVSN